MQVEQSIFQTKTYRSNTEIKKGLSLKAKVFFCSSLSPLLKIRFLNGCCDKMFQANSNSLRRKGD